MRIRWRGLELPNRVRRDRGHPDRHLRQVLRRAVRARLRHDRRQQPAPHPALQPGRQRRHPRQDPGRAARDLAPSPASSRTSPTSSSTSRAWSSRTRQRPAEDDPHRPPREGRRPRRPTSSTDETVQIINPEHIIATHDRRRAVRRRDDRRERPRLPHRRRERRQGTRDRHHPGRFELLAGRPREVRDRGDPRRPADQLRQAGAWRSGPTARSAPQMALVEGGQDPAQAPEPVHPVRRAGPGDRRWTSRSRSAPRPATRSTTSWSAS